MSIKDQYNQAADAADSFTQKLQGELKRVLENAKDVKKTFKEMEDQVSDKQFKMINGQLDKTGRIDQVKKDIARVKTKMNDEFLGDKNAKKNIGR